MRGNNTKLIVAAALIVVIAVMLYFTTRKTVENFQFSMSDYALAAPDYADATLDQQTNPDNAPKEDCWVYYVPPQYQEACKLGYFDRSVANLQARKAELDARAASLTEAESTERNLINVTIQGKNTLNIPNNGYGCKLGFADAKSQIKLDTTDQTTISSRNNETASGSTLNNTSSWAYCWSKVNTQSEARDKINSIGSTGVISATKNLVAQFADSPDQYVRVNFDKLNYEDVKNSICKLRIRDSKVQSSTAFIGFDIMIDNNNTFRINGWNIYVSERNQLKTIEEYNPRSSVLDIYALLFDYKVVGNNIVLGPKAPVNIAIIRMDPVCGILTETPQMDMKKIDLKANFGATDLVVMANNSSIDISNGIAGLDAQYDVLASQYMSFDGAPTKKNGVQVTRYTISRQINYSTDAYSTAALDNIFKNFTSNPRITNQISGQYWESNDYVAAETVGYLKIIDAGWYKFKLSSDDAGELYVNDVLISTHYGYHGNDWNGTENSLYLEPGFVKLYTRFIQLEGPGGVYAYWIRPGNTNWEYIPDGAFFYDDNNELNAIITKMNTLTTIRDAMTRNLSNNVVTLMESMKNKPFVLTNNSESRSSYISANDRVYLWMGSPDSVIKPALSPSTRQVLQQGVIDVTRFVKIVNPPQSISFSDPATYTLSVWVRVDAPHDGVWRNIFSYSVDENDRTPALWIMPQNHVVQDYKLTNDTLMFHIRHQTRSPSTTYWNYGINVAAGKNFKKWVHLAVTCDRDVMNVYINGTKMADAETGGDYGYLIGPRANGMTFTWGTNIDVNQKKFRFGTNVSKEAFSGISTAGPYYVQKLYWYNAFLSPTQISELANESIAMTSASAYVPSNVPNTLSALFASVNTSGEASIRIDNTVYKVYVQVTNFNNVTQKWLLILNYLHKGNTNPELMVRTLYDDFPTLRSTTLGEDESKDPASWGHAGNSLLKRLNDKCGPIRMMRFFAKGGNATNSWSQSAPQSLTRTIHFTTTDTSILNYAMTGAGNAKTPSFQFTALSDHNATIPGNCPDRFVNQGDYALTDFPFWRGAQAHWGIRGGRAWGNPNRWEVDDWSDGFKYHTHHQVWVTI